MGNINQIRKIVLFLSLFLILAGCVGQEKVGVEGKSKHWKAEMKYPVSKSVQSGEGSIEYIGDEKLKSLRYEIYFPKIFTLGASGSRDKINGNDTVFSLGVLNPPHDNGEILRNHIDEISITVEWETLSGKVKEEVVDLS